jgi:uncharacterized protein (TIGR03435 family)
MISATAFAQSTHGDAPRFEVASIRPCKPDSGPARKGDRKSLDGRKSTPVALHLNCQTVMSLIQWTYVNFAADRFNPLGSVPILGGPGWIQSDLYEIHAKAEHPQSQGALNGSMLRVLLEERFQLKMSRRTREAPVFALTIAKDGPKLQPAQPGGCIVFDPEHPPQLEPGKPFPQACGMSRLTNNGWDVPGATMTELCRLLADNLDRNVIDKTGLAGKFDVHLSLSAADLGHPGAGQHDPAAPATDATDAAIAIKSALQKVGLRLASSRGTEQVLVIDHIEKPSQN